MAGHGGLFVISWAQVRLGGAALPPEEMRAGQLFGWSGRALRLDGPSHILPLGPALGQSGLHRRAAAALRGVLARDLDAGGEQNLAPPDEAPAGPPVPAAEEQNFTLTDGQECWTGTLIDPGAGRPPLLMFMGPVPPQKREVRVVASAIGPGRRAGGREGGVVCFTPGTMIATEAGLCPVEAIGEGMRVQTKDNGCQPVLWIGRRRLTGARIAAMPWLAPVRLRADALEGGVPDAGLLVSPDHRLLLRGRRARALFGEAEVLVAAADLVDERRVTRERLLRHVEYIHLLLPAHEIAFANGVETESFHPAMAGQDRPGEDGSARPDPEMPQAEHYGPFARRVLSASEAALLTHAV